MLLHSADQGSRVDADSSGCREGAPRAGRARRMEQVVAASQRYEIDPDELQTRLACLSEQQAKRASDPDWQPPSITEDEAESDGPVDLDGLDGVGR